MNLENISFENDSEELKKKIGQLPDNFIVPLESKDKKFDVSSNKYSDNTMEINITGEADINFPSKATIRYCNGTLAYSEFEYKKIKYIIRNF